MTSVVSKCLAVMEVAVDPEEIVWDFLNPAIVN